MKSFLLIAVFLTAYLFITGTGQAAATDAVFSSVSGKVSVRDLAGKIRMAQNDSGAVEGETVRVEDGAKASLVFFDGSSLEAKPHSQFVLSALRHPSPNEKKIRFNLLFGGLLAKVQKLLTANSQFEIEAGGVVCGVRGTEFSVDYYPSKGLVGLKVMKGSVYAKAGGSTTTVPAGQEKKFLNGSPLVGAGGGGASQTLTRSAGRLEPAIPGTLALDDLSAQFTGTLSINGSSIVRAPVLGSSLQSNLQLMNVAGPVGIILPTLPLKLGP